MTAKAIDSTGQTDFWHYAVGSDRKGPVPRPTLAKLLASGEISAETYVWQPGMDNWVHLGDAAPLKALVAGIEGDGAPEDFVEEDTTFTSQEELRASHHQLDHEDADAGLSQDTIVEPAVYTLPMGSKKATDVKLAAVPSPAAAPKPVAVAAKPAVQAVPKAASVDDDDIFGASSAPASSSGSDIFSSAVSTSPASASADIFSSGSPMAEDENIAGVHGRRQSSVLFSLDELGREDGKKGPSSSQNDAFVTDSSGLIDIKAVATSHKAPVGEDPFGGSGVGLVMPARSSGPGVMAVPIVGRKRSMGPWLLAAVALLVGGGVALALILTGGNNNKGEPPVANNGTQPQTAPKENPATPDPKLAAVDPKATTPDPKATTPDPKATTPDPKAPEAVAGDPASPANPNPNPVVDPASPGTANPTVEKKPDTKKPEDKIKIEAKKPDDKKPDEPVVAEVKEVKTVPVKSTTENTQKVNSLLDKLSDKPDDKKTTVETDTGLPDKLSAAVVRNTIKGKFGSCGSMVTSGGPVSVMTSFVIAGSGVVQSARVTDAAGVGGDVQRCVVGVIKGTTFSKFKEATMTVNLPVKLL